MSSQARDAQAPVLEGEVAGPGYGAMDLHGAPQRPELPNGVPSRQAATEQGGFAAGADEVRAVTGAPRASGLHESEMARVEAATGDGPRTVERPFLSPESNQRLPDLASPQGPPGVANPEPELSRDTTRTLDVEVMYGGEQGPSVVRWVARLTDFLRTTATAATGAGGLQERVLEGLGITGTQGSPSPPQTLTAPQQHQQQQVPQQQLMPPRHQPRILASTQQAMSPTTRRSLVQALNFSPPEELPPPMRPTRSPEASALFTREQLQRLRALEMDAPTLYGGNPGQDHASASTASSAVQAEVQRQLHEFLTQHRSETVDLRQQVEQLRREKMDLERLAGDRALHSQGLPAGDRALHSQGLPAGDRALHSQGLPQGDRALHSQGLPQGDRALHSAGLPQGDRALHSQGLPQGDRALHSAGLPQGDRALHSQGLPQGDRALHSAGLPQGDRALHSQGLPQGDRALHSAGLPAGDRALHSHDLPAGDRASNAQESQARAGGDDGNVPEGPGSRPESPTQPTPMELLGVIATGMRQLQEVQLKQMEKKDAPEVVKPGISSLPMLDSPGKETSPVDIQDWLEEVGSIMGDLSDTSHEWWRGVRDVADDHYKRWVTATPLEKLTITLPKDPKLEHGKYGRVNSRAAGMLLSALPTEVKSEMVTKKCTGSSTSLVYKLLTMYRPGGEQEKTLLLEQLTTPEGVATPDLAVQALRKWGRWFSRAKDLTVTVPDPVLMVKGLATIVGPVLTKNQDAWLRTTMMRNRLQLDSNPTESTTLDYHRHLQAEMELLCTASTTPVRAPPRIKAAAAAVSAGGSSATTARQKPEKKDKPCRWFGKSEEGCKKGMDCPFQHDWGGVSKVGRCLLCSAVGHQKKDCSTKRPPDGGQTAPKGKGEKGAQSSPTASATSSAPATRSVTTSSGTKDTPQPGPEPSPTSSPSSAAKEPPGDIQQILTDAHRMLKTMMATTSPTASSTSTGAPTYESIQRQLDEMKLKAMKVTGGAREEEGRGALLDSGATHVLRPAKDHKEHQDGKEVPVVLAGDEKKILRQTAAGSIILDPALGEEVQTIIPLGKLVDSLGCTLKWTRGALRLKHPKYGTIQTRLRAGCPEIVDAVQAAQLIAELETRRVDDLRQQTSDLQNRLNAIKMMEVKKNDWREDLAAYAEEGCVVDGLQLLYKSPIFKDLPEDVLIGMVPNVEANDEKGWEYLKALPVNRRVRKKMMRSKVWVVNLHGGRKLKEDPIQSLNGQVNVDTNTDVIVINAEILLDGGWCMRGPAYKALMWGAMTSRVKAVIGCPPAKTYGHSRPSRTGEEPYGITGLSPTEMYFVNKETTLAARQYLLYLVAHACSQEKGVAWMMENPGSMEDSRDSKEGVSLWQTPMSRAFMDVVRPLGVEATTWEVPAQEGRTTTSVTMAENLNMKALLGENGPSSLHEARVRRTLTTALQEKGVASTKTWESATELRRLSAEQGWRLHLRRDHVPYRKDCEYCVMMMGTGKQHRRTKQKSAYVLSVDVGGPMRVRSKDTHGTGYRFFLAAAYTRPMFPDQEDPPEPDDKDLAPFEYDFSDLDLEEPVEDQEKPEDVVFPSPEDKEEMEPFDFEEEEIFPPELRAMSAGDKLWDDDERAEEEQVADAAEEEQLEGNHEIPVDHLYFVKPLKSKSSKHVMMAIQEIVLQLKQENLPVVRIHSDRAHEMRSLALRAWTLDNGIWLTRTEGQSPQSNGTAERAVRFLKGRARMLLRASGLTTEHWATAMVAAAHRQREERLRPEEPDIPCPYGTRVAIKKKRYGDGGRHDLLPHWTKGTYMGPVWDVKGGSAVLEDETKRFTVTTHLRARLHDPGTLNEEEPLKVEPLRPARRLRDKSAIGADGLAVRSLDCEQAPATRKQLVKEIMNLLSKDPVHKIKRPQLKNDGRVGDNTSYSTVGAYNFGGVFGITKYTQEAPELTKKVAQLLRHDFPDQVFTSATIIKNAALPTHRDVYNDRNSRNLISPLQVSRGAGVWEELCEGDIYKGKFHIMEINGSQVPGQVHQLKGPVTINPRRWHCAIQGDEGVRVVIAGHTIGSWRKLSESMRQELDAAGFVLPDQEQPGGERMAAAARQEEPDFFVEPEDIVEDYHNMDTPVEREEDINRCAKVAVENLYTRNIEKVLQELDGDLRVVHTVHPSEVEQNLEAWIPSMASELKTLEGIGAVKRIRGQAARDYMAQPGAVIVPGKAVYTVKPPSTEGGVCRRKTRIVSCGNFQPKDNSETNYSGGAVAEAVRLGISEASRRRWCACTGDVVSAFLRAPVPQGTCLALRPPMALVRAGLAERDEVWIVQTALYGFRSSPRWWSNHRTTKMREAVTKGGLTFLQGQADADVWQIRSAQNETVGLMIIYVDDFLILGPKAVCDDAYEWMATTWEATPCQFATPTSSVRFLGMEIRQEVNSEGEITAYTLDQEGYIEEVLRHHDVKPTEKSLLPAAKEWMSLDPEGFPSTYSPEQLKAAQSMTGELAWLGQRCRPDLSYTVSIMGSMTTKDPVRVTTIARKTLSYLNATKEWKLRFISEGDPHLVTFTDSSYSPEGEKSHGGAVVFWAGSPVAWKSGRQSLVTTSSAETELLAASEGTTLMLSIDAMLSDFGVSPTRRELRVDNSAAITLASEEGGSWRTRHLKVRAAALRQRLQDGWATISHCPGEWQLADGLTKILASRRMDTLMREWGLGPPGDPPRQGELRSLQAPAEQSSSSSNSSSHSKADNTTITTTAHGRDLGCCTGLLVLIQQFMSVQGHRTETDPLPEPLALSGSGELYLLVVMLVICTVAVWEGCKHVFKSRGEAVRLRSMTAPPDKGRLSKVELRTLSALLQRDPETLSKEERHDLIHLAGLCGSDVSEAVGMNVASTLPAKVTRASTATCSAGIRPGEDDGLEHAPRAEPQPREQGRKTSKMPSPSPMSSWDNPLWNERPELVSGPLRGIQERRRRDAAVQCELQGEIPKKVYFTPKGTCVHSSKACSTLRSSTRFQERDMCQVCVQGQRVETEYRGSQWLD